MRDRSGPLTHNLTQLGQGLKTLQTTLGKTYENTTILVMSEFGRTIQENGTKGTDHGHGNVMWLTGGGVNGGKSMESGADWPDHNVTKIEIWP